MSSKRNESTPRRVRRSVNANGMMTTAVILAATLAVGASASAASAAGSSSGLAAAKAVIAAHTGPVDQFVAPGPAVNGKSLKGKSVWFVELGPAPTFEDDAAGLQQATKALGMTVKICGGEYTPATEAGCITQAVDAHAAGILTDSFYPATTSIAYAKSHKVPLIAGSEPGQDTPLLQFMPYTSGSSQAQIAMAWIIVHSGGKANVITNTSYGDKGTQTEGAAAANALKKNCPSCGYVDVPNTPSNYTTAIPQGVSTSMLKDPSLTIAYTQFDPEVSFFSQGMKSAGRSLPIVSAGAILSQMQVVKAHGYELADVGNNTNYLSWIMVDRLIRMILHKPAPTHVYVPTRVFDSSNVSKLTMTQSASTSGAWYGPTAQYMNGFKKLWGVA
jgi:ribose transport system substrate-binding protein